MRTRDNTPPAAGTQFGRLTVVRMNEPDARGAMQARVRCVCDTEKIVPVNRLRMGRAQSCGCIRREQLTQRSQTHGHAGRGRVTATYRSWQAMWSRCTDENNEKYPDYGARGITVCDRWQSFESFLADMGERPEGKTLDRHPNGKGNYEPRNCRWATPTEQSRNRDCAALTLDSATTIVRRVLAGESTRAIASDHGIAQASVRRIARGQSWPEALKAAREAA